MTAAAALKGRTEYEAGEYARDHGRTAAMAVGQQLYARHLYACAAEDMEILGLREIPEPRPQKWPVTGGTDEECRARVDAWAKRHGVRAGTDEASGHYKAVLSFGPVRLEVYMVPAKVMADRVKAARDRADAIHAAVAAMQPERVTA